MRGPLTPSTRDGGHATSSLRISLVSQTSAYFWKALLVLRGPEIASSEHVTKVGWLRCGTEKRELEQISKYALVGEPLFRMRKLS